MKMNRLADAFGLLVLIVCLTVSVSGLWSVTRADAPSQLKNEGPAILIGGLPVSSFRNLNLIAGNGVSPSCAPNVALQRTDCTFNFNSALIATHDQVHHNPNYCRSTNGTIAYTCKLPTKALAAYQRGDSFLLDVDVPCNLNCSLVIDSIAGGPVSIKKRDGTTDPGVAPVQDVNWQWINYNGTVFVLP